MERNLGFISHWRKMCFMSMTSIKISEILKNSI